MNWRERFVAPIAIAASLALPACAGQNETRDPNPAYVEFQTAQAQMRDKTLIFLANGAPAAIQEDLVLTGAVRYQEGVCVGWHLPGNRYAITVNPAVYEVQMGEGKIFRGYVLPPSFANPELGRNEFSYGPFRVLAKKGHKETWETALIGIPHDIISLGLNSDNSPSTHARVQIVRAGGRGYFVTEDGGPIMITANFSRSSSQVGNLPQTCATLAQNARVAVGA